MAELAIEVEGLTRDFGALRAVDHLSFTVGVGEVFGFLGPNGAGKTTTLRMLTTLLAPTAGTARIFGHDVNRDGYNARRQFGVVPEESNIYTELTAWQNLMFGAELYSIHGREREQRGKELLQMFELWDRRNSRAETFSKGMRRRLTIAVSLMHQPRLLFLDEPTSGLDVQSVLAIRELIHKLNEMGATIFLTTHQIEEANLLCDRVSIINRGQLVALDTPERLKRTIEQVQAVEVSLSSGADDDVTALLALPTVIRGGKMGDKVRLYTSEVDRTVRLVMDYAESVGKPILSLNTLGPSLEEVFLHLINGPVGSTEKRQSRGGKNG